MTPAPESVQLQCVGTVIVGDNTVFLLGPYEPGFWPHFTASTEYQDGGQDPLDRWSKRTIKALAQHWGGRPVFPSDGPPYPPFLDWAKRSSRAWISPVGLMLHDSAGLWLSFRGAIEVPGHLGNAQSMHNPCTTCVHQPCLTACPVGAMSGDTYDVAKCHAWLDQDAGAECMQKGCAIRRTCPISQSYGRVEAQSAFHMKAFHRT